MSLCFKTITFFVTAFLLSSCAPAEAPQDSNGKTPQHVLLETYVHIAEGNYDKARKNFSQAYLDGFVLKNGSTFVSFHSNPKGIDTTGWETEWLQTELIGNDYNANVWRVQLIVDEGKGNSNRPGVVHDLHIVDEVWKIVFWGDYPKS